MRIWEKVYIYIQVQNILFLIRKHFYSCHASFFIMWPYSFLQWIWGTPQLYWIVAPGHRLPLWMDWWVVLTYMIFPILLYFFLFLFVCVLVSKSLSSCKTKSQTHPLSLRLPLCLLVLCSRRNPQQWVWEAVHWVGCSLNSSGGVQQILTLHGPNHSATKAELFFRLSQLTIPRMTSRDIISTLGCSMETCIYQFLGVNGTV